MLRLYTRDPRDPAARASLVGTEVSAPLVPAEPGSPDVVWYDLLSPTTEEKHFAETQLGLDLPTREEMDEIELSSRLYYEDSAEFMTILVLVDVETGDPLKRSIAFILKDQALVTIRYAEPRPFLQFTSRLSKISAPDGESVMLGLVEAMIDQLADVLEGTGTEIDAISREIFRSHVGDALSASYPLQGLIHRIGRKGDLVTMGRESLMTIARLATYHQALDLNDRKPSKEARARIKLIQRDVISLSDHATFLSGKITFMLEATLGLINLEQNQIIKIFSVAAVMFLPPTLVASIYGMNFKRMPELDWFLGYPWAIVLILLSALLPYLYFKRRGWL